MADTPKTDGGTGTDTSAAPRTLAAFAGDSPSGLASLDDGSIVVSANPSVDDGLDSSAPRVVQLDRDGAVLQELSVGDASTRLGGVAAVDTMVYVLTTEPSQQVVQADLLTREVSVLAALPDLPACLGFLVPEPCEEHLVSSAPQAVDLVVYGDRLLMSDWAQGVVFWVDPKTAETGVWAKGAPLSSLTDDAGPTGLDVTTEGIVTVVSGSAGAVVVRVADDRGRTVAEVARYGAEDGARDVATVPAGFAVSLARAGVVDVLADDGSVHLQLRDPDPLFEPEAILSVGTRLAISDPGTGRILQVELSE